MEMFSQKALEDIFQLFHGVITKDYVIAEELCKTEICCVEYQIKCTKSKIDVYVQNVKHIESDKRRIAKEKTFSALTSYRQSFENIVLITKNTWESDRKTLDKNFQIFKDIFKTFKTGIRDQTASTFKQYNADRIALKNKRDLYEKTESQYKKIHGEYQEVVTKYRRSMADTKATDAQKNKDEFLVNKLKDSLDLLEKNYVDSAEVFNNESDEFYNKKMPCYLNALRCLHTRYSEILNEFVKECKTFHNELTANRQDVVDKLKQIKQSYFSGKQDSIMITQLLDQEEFKTQSTIVPKLHSDIDLATGKEVEIPLPKDIPSKPISLPKIELASLHVV